MSRRTKVLINIRIIAAAVIVRIIAILLTLAPAASGLAASYGDFDVAAAPSWTDSVPVDLAASTPRDSARFGIHDLLLDHQVRVTASGEEHFSRTVRKVLSPSGVQNASELMFDFDPSFERLVLHHVEIVRDGKRVNALKPSEIRVIEKEDDAADRIYDGDLTALVFLGDVRPGDVLDYSWSTVGRNPLLGGRYVDEIDFSPSVPAAHIRHRILWPAVRKLSYRASDRELLPAVSSRGGVETFVWEQRNVEPVELEDDTPAWFEPWRFVQLSEFEDWNSVAKWAADLFVVDAPSQKLVDETAARIRAAHPGRRDQFLAAVRLVQDDIRYLGIEMGKNSHEPRQPGETLTQRWGDCKDKALLLSALLRALGADAHPALVNTKLRRRLDSRLPSPFLFDHVITRCRIDGQTYWIDATLADQGGSLQTIDTPDDERALIVDAATTGLETIKVRSQASTTVERTYSMKRADAPVSLEIATTYRGSDADAMRTDLAAMSAKDLARERLNRAATTHPHIRALHPPQVSDDRAANVIVVHEEYEVRELWSAGVWTFVPDAIDAALRVPDTVVRTMPLAFDHPLRVEERVRFVFPEALPVEPSSDVVESPAFRYEMHADRSGNVVTIRYSLRSLTDAVAPADVPSHLTRVAQVRRSIGLDVDRPAVAAAPESLLASTVGGSASRWFWGTFAMVTFVGVCCVIAIPRATRRRARSSARSHALFAPGEAPASAIVAANENSVLRAAAEFRCDCGKEFLYDGDIQRARYDERDLVIVTGRCACGRERVLYFTLGDHVSPLGEPARTA